MEKEFQSLIYGMDGVSNYLFKRGCFSWAIVNVNQSKITKEQLDIFTNTMHGILKDNISLFNEPKVDDRTITISMDTSKFIINHRGFIVGINLPTPPPHLVTFVEKQMNIYNKKIEKLYKISEMIPKYIRDFQTQDVALNIFNGVIVNISKARNGINIMFSEGLFECMTPPALDWMWHYITKDTKEINTIQVVNASMLYIYI